MNTIGKENWNTISFEHWNPKHNGSNFSLDEVTEMVEDSLEVY